MNQMISLHPIIFRQASLKLIAYGVTPRLNIYSARQKYFMLGCFRFFGGRSGPSSTFLTSSLVVLVRVENLSLFLISILFSMYDSEISIIRTLLLTIEGRIVKVSLCGACYFHPV